MPRSASTVGAVVALLSLIAVTGCGAGSAERADGAASAESGAPVETPTPTPTIEPVETIATTPISVEDYLSLTEERSADGGVKLEGVQDDYRALAAVFPLALPNVYAFPVESRAANNLDDEKKVQFSATYGENEVFHFWLDSTATAAYASHLRGDSTAANRYLDAIEDGYATPIRRHTIEDPENGYIADVVDSARRGIFGQMILQNVNPFLEIEQYEAVAAQAGDVF
ncbi:hypothetical protein [Paramicrobacterium chengjingii]|uniref:Lipoprotein n=1 Tax=Paramicrobacterium chengjingii TaxID=2769067 RepID=A0ABX6YIJ0_9MICO|nr:hypothetical protein [Microbacterium chengjingii]QPZ38636.1 hypothetical protein HCR76_00540 [Microbacterium chengjingii]